MYLSSYGKLLLSCIFIASYEKSNALILLILIISCQRYEKLSIDFEKEKSAIKAVIAKETESYYKQDFEAPKSTYLQSPAFRKFGYWEGYDHKVTSNIGFESLAQEKKKPFDANETI